MTMPKAPVIGPFGPLTVRSASHRFNGVTSTTGSPRVLIANRGEIAIRIARATRELGWSTRAIFSEDDADALHVQRADEAIALVGSGAAAYLDAAQIVAAAVRTDCTMVHPGYGFLSENVDFAQRCAEAGLTFVGPGPEVLAAFGDKLAARRLAVAAGVPVAEATGGPTTVHEAREFLAALGTGASVMVKAIAGGGGRGMRIVTAPEQLEDAFARCQAEAAAAFGDDTLYVERYVRRARHIEVQVLGDGTGAVIHLGERDCSIQRQQQKLVEIAPAPGLNPVLRDRLTAAATGMAAGANYDNAGTFEFLVDLDAVDEDRRFMFLEVNPRLQVEHTVTEEVFGVDIVHTQLRLAAGATLAELGLTQPAVGTPRGFAVQVRVNAERMKRDGTSMPATGTLTEFAPPAGPGVRVDSCGYRGYAMNPRFDSLIAKVVCHSGSPDFADAVRRTALALDDFRLDGVAANIGFLRTVLAHPEFTANRYSTSFVAEHASELVTEESEPLLIAPPGVVMAPLSGTVIDISVAPGDLVASGAPVVILEAMKMHHEIVSEVGGRVRAIGVKIGDTLAAGASILEIDEDEAAGAHVDAAAEIDLDAIPDNLAEVLERRRATEDEARPDAVARRRKTGRRTARENIADLVDDDSFVEYGGLATAAQRARLSHDELIAKTPADGIITGIGAINGAVVGDPQCAIVVYDYTVMAGTQGWRGHRKMDRIFELCEEVQRPLVLYAEGGGGRPGDTDTYGVFGMDIMTFRTFGRLSGLVPRIGVVAGRCFAGNAALLGCCDVIIATEDSTIGMGGPAMIEGGGLGVYTPEQVGPPSVQVPNGVIDVLVADEAEATAVARRCVSYFQGPVDEWAAPDQRILRHVVPPDQRKIYPVRDIIATLADVDSMLELRPGFGHGMVTSLIRIEGRPVGVLANNPAHLGGAVDSDGADKGARFMQLCDAFDIPLLLLSDTPGMLVGPEAERDALVRHCSRLFVTGATATVPTCTIILRKGYGLAAQAMAAGSYHAPVYTAAWPTGSFGAMGVEGSVRLGYRKELEAIEDEQERAAAFARMVAAVERTSSALNMASHFELDDVIDPADTRELVARAFRSAGPAPPRSGRKRTMVDTW
jgi:acetyl/propionyl-CoA carboxylase alpha subunit/acetyl-CoA carboxylase carboxyltransferase component